MLLKTVILTTYAKVKVIEGREVGYGIGEMGESGGRGGG